ncbi:MAG TPA: NTP transferase domain-containing protein [Polyangiaceae bacterium]|nr:NTP transferase domain-containing protein [Polyangiaceae bacterium]
MQIVVLTGGLAARVRPEAEQTPKSLLLVRGRPLIDWQLDRFSASGARSVVLCVGYLGEQIETHVKRALDRGLVVSYSYDGAEQVGTGGALRRAYARLEDEFVLTYGDCYLPFDYAAPLHDLRAHPDALGTMSVCKNRNQVGPSSVVLDGDCVAKYEAGATATELDYADYGAIALRRSALDGIEDGAVWGVEALFRKLARKRQLRAFVAPERSYEVGSPEGKADLERHLASLPAEIDAQVLA